MKVKLGILVNSRESLIELQLEKMNSLVSLKILKVIRELNPIFIDFETLRISKVKEFGSTNENGQIEVLEENRNDFQKEMSAIQEEMVDLKFEKINLSEFVKSDGSSIDISVITLNNLEWLINYDL